MWIGSTSQTAYLHFRGLAQPPNCLQFLEGLALPPNCCFTLWICLASQLLTFILNWQNHSNITCNIPQVTHNPNILIFKKPPLLFFFLTYLLFYIIILSLIMFICTLLILFLKIRAYLVTVFEIRFLFGKNKENMFWVFFVLRA